ncbi:uncharacterized protein C4orf54-like [Osmerus mordax]|uniref:uncharacterized protein C4orf54-like n=1 Tax=Osmerus mordax TaxID=8014 RepID=UPI00350F7FA1
MEAVEKTLTYQEHTGLNRKLLPVDNNYKDKCQPDTKSLESNYVDLDDLLDMKSEGTKTVKVTFTGEGNQLAVFKCNSDTSGDRSPGVRVLDDNVDQICSKDYHEHSQGDWTDRTVVDEPPVETSLTGVPNCNVDFQNGNTREFQPKIEFHDDNLQNVGSECEELQYTDMYLNSKSESDDAASVVLSEAEHCEPDTVEDESHYITTHEIQLTELDHDVDYDFGRGTCWDLEDDNLVYSFVDYASFESDETAEGTLIVEGKGQTKVKSSKAHNNNVLQRAGGAVVSTEQESDLCDSDKCASSDESAFKNQNGSGNPSGQIHLSIKTSSRAINDSNNIIEKENICYHTKHMGDGSHFFFTSTDARAETLCDRAQYFIPAPGRQHLATKLRGKDINEYSSGASSSISELDDADKEVRNLTAKSFRSLACPYFDAINLSTSSESSMSEYSLGLNKWSAYVDLKYGTMSHGRENNLLAHKSAQLEISKHAELKNRNGKATCNKKVPQTRMYALNKKMSSSQQESSSTKNIQMKGQPGQGEVITLTETLNFRCNVETGLPERGRLPKCSENAKRSRSKDEVTGNAPGRQGCEASYEHSDAVDSMEDTHKKAIFASSLLKNVISKKMQFEQERKMERGEIRDTYPSHSPCFQCKDQDMRERGLRRGLPRQSSETSSGFTPNSLDELEVEESRPGSCDTSEERSSDTETESLEGARPTTELAVDIKKDPIDSSRGPLSRSQNSAFKSWKDGEQEPQKEPEVDGVLGDTPSTQNNTGGNELDTGAVSSKLTKLSHLFVPSSQLLPKDQEAREQLSQHSPGINAPLSLKVGGEGHLGMGGYGNAKKVPEIKICLRSVKENKLCPLNIANLLTPKIGYTTVNPMKTAGNSKCHVLAVSDKIPHFTVRDIRDNKVKFQTPIYQVRDVRKLVKSSYPSISLDSCEQRPQVNPPVSAEIRENNEGSKKETNKTPSPSPIVIKCQSVNNSNLKQRAQLSDTPLRKQNDADRSSPKVPPENAKHETSSPFRITGRVAPVFSKQANPDQSEIQFNIETKTAKTRQEKSADTGERKPETKIPKQAALEKLKAAVKTMEQLYVFDRNEWKRKTQAPRPITDSHVLSLIAREEQGGPVKADLEEEPGGASCNERLTHFEPQTFVNMTETRNAREDKETVKIIHVPYNEDTFKIQSQQSKTFSNKSVFHLWNNNQTPVSTSSTHNNSLQSGIQSQTPSIPMKSISCNTSKVPLSFKISPTRRAPVDRVRLKNSPTDISAQQQSSKPGNPESENYLTIPVKGYVGEIKFPSQDRKLTGNPTTIIQTTIDDTKRCDPSALPLRHTPIVMETHSPDPQPATIYHNSVPASLQPPQPHVFCFSPPIPTLSPTPSGVDSYQQIQRKMLLDPTTGQCYLVDTPVQPATKRLFDPETGQFVEVPMPAHQPPINPMTPVTPVPMSISPLALSPGAFAPTYMIYPSFIPSPAFPTQTVSAQGLSRMEDDNASKKPQGKHTGPHAGKEANMTGAESPYYSATGGSVQHPVLPVSRGHVTARGVAATSDGKPVISITTQQGPRIIAPPSFDGTTMSFVVEHR